MHNNNHGDPKSEDLLYEKLDESQLYQGDILNRVGLSSILEKYHPYYDDKKNTHLMVVTQSCDLVKRSDGKCKVDYITLVPVRPVRAFIKKLVKKIQTNNLHKKLNILPQNKKSDILGTLSRLMNNNLDEYFYLPSSLKYQLQNNSVAYLRLPISIKAEHYQACLDSRSLSLEGNFRAKLGHILGEIYSRVGTKDYTETINFKSERENILKAVFSSWVEPEKIEQFQQYLDKKEINIMEIDNEVVKEMFFQFKHTSKNDMIADEISEVCNDILKLNLDEGKLEDLSKALLISPVLDKKIFNK